MATRHISINETDPAAVLALRQLGDANRATYESQGCTITVERIGPVHARMMIRETLSYAETFLLRLLAGAIDEAHELAALDGGARLMRIHKLTNRAGYKNHPDGVRPFPAAYVAVSMRAFALWSAVGHRLACNIRTALHREAEADRHAETIANVLGEG